MSGTNRTNVIVEQSKTNYIASMPHLKTISIPRKLTIWYKKILALHSYNSKTIKHQIIEKKCSDESINKMSTQRKLDLSQITINITKTSQEFSWTNFHLLLITSMTKREGLTISESKKNLREVSFKKESKSMRQILLYQRLVK